MAATAGISEKALRQPRWRHVFRDVWVAAGLPDTRELRLECARLVLPAYAVLCNVTAAWLYGADVRHQDDLDVHVSFPPGRRRRPRPGVVVTQETLAETDICVIQGLPVTTPVRTAFDALRLLKPPASLVVADALLYAGLTSMEELSRYFGGQRRLRNLRVGERLLDFVHPLTESPMETRTRWELVLGGLPAPVVQFEVYAGGDFVARLDLAFPEHKVGVEYDGAWHWERRRDDDRRRDRLRALGWTIIVVSADDVYGNPQGMCARVAAALRSAKAS
jgi:hypothetical protein